MAVRLIFELRDKGNVTRIERDVYSIYKWVDPTASQVQSAIRGAANELISGSSYYIPEGGEAK